jgi:CheY-like chemotaxis protein
MLVADDDPAIRDLVAEVLKEAGYAVQTVGDGLSALVAIRATRPALVLLDVAMPVMTGDETLRQLRAEGSAVPVIMMTAGTNPYRFLQEGATAVLAKPFDLDRLLTIIAQLLTPLDERHLGA